MFEPIVWYASAVAGAVYLLSPVAARNTLCFAPRCQLAPIPLEQLPEQIAAEFRRRISEFANLGFELLGCFDCGALVSETRSYVAYCSNHTTSEFANISALNTANGPASYFEFSSRFPDGHCIETNNNAVLPVLPGNPAIRVFRFAAFREPRALLHIHRQLAEKYAPGWCPLGEPGNAEIQRYARMIENCGPRQTRDGYMKFDETADSYRLTWRGAVRMTWLGLWPVKFFRKMIHHHAMQSELRSLETRAEGALQKA